MSPPQPPARQLLAISLLVLGAVGSPALAANPAQEPDDAYAVALARYEECLQRLPLLMHTRGRDALAATRDLRALQILMDSYREPVALEEQSRYLLAGTCFRQFTREEHLPLWDEWRERHDKDSDSYLWYRALTLHSRHRGEDELVKIAEGKATEYMKAAALSALADQRSPVLEELIPGMCRDLPWKDEPKRVMVGALGRALLSLRSELDAEETQAAARAYARLFDREYKLSDTAKRTAGRYLGLLLDTQRLWSESEPWLKRIEARGATGAPTRSSQGETTSRPAFFGLQATGDRVAYVFDMSDSMCTPIDASLKPAGPVSGKRPERKKGDLPTVDDIPWVKVENRFDLAREHLKISLQRLDEDKKFAVIFFGDHAGLLDSCKGMIKASRANVSRVIKELEAITPGPATGARPHGTLRGLTNLHGGLRRAFQVRAKGIAEEHEYIDSKALMEGADTIFLLSDGDPTWDDWPQPDTNYGEDMVGDPETREPGGGGTIMYYRGPYGYPHMPHLLDDLVRLNLFRHVEIHCVGIGEADMGFLSQIARIGLGGKTHDLRM